MSNKFINIIKDVINNKADIQILEKICTLQEKLRYSYNLDDELGSIFGLNFFSKIFSEKFFQLNFKKEKLFWNQLFRKWCSLFLENIIFKHI